MKKCSSCGEKKDISLFNKKSSNKDGLERYCKTCHKLINRAHYNNNKEAYIERAHSQRRAMQEWFIGLKQQLRCAVCNEDKYWRLCFHHTDPSTKESTVSSLLRRGSKKKILTEIEKCAVLCHNCHSDIHHVI